MTVATKQQFSEIREHRFKDQQPPNGFADWKAFAESIPLYDIVDKSLLLEDDLEPFYIVLDIAVLGAVSSNGLIYDETLFAELERQLPGLGGLRGHLERDSSAFPIEVVDWVGHVRVGNTLYAKGYVAPGQERKSIKRIIGRGGEIRTSIDVWAILEWVDKKAKTYRLREIDVHTIDLVGAKKAALRKYQSGNAIATRETEEVEKPMDPETKDSVNINLTEQYVQNLQSQIETLTEQRDTAQTSLAEAKTQILEGRQYASIVGNIRLNFGYGEDVSNDAIVPKLTEMYTVLEAAAKRLGVSYTSINVAVEELITARETAQKQEAEHRLESAVKSFTANWMVVSDPGKESVGKFLKNFKRAVSAEMKGEETPEDVAKRLWEEEYQSLGAGVLASLGGPPANVGGSNSHKEAGSLSDEELDKLSKRHAR
jgi:hypothetical protein